MKQPLSSEKTPTPTSLLDLRTMDLIWEVRGEGRSEIKILMETHERFRCGDGVRKRGGGLVW